MQKYTRNVERLGLDECFLDVTDEIRAAGGGTVAGHLYTGKESVSYVDSLAAELDNGFARLAAGSQLAAKIRSDLVDTVGLTSCAGIAHSKLLAKLGGSLNKPNAQTTILPQFLDNLLNSLKVSQIPWIGRKACELLTEAGLEFVSDVKSCSYDKLSKLLPDMAEKIYLLCHGIDDSEVVPSGAAKQYSVEDSFHQCSNVKEAYARLDALCGKLLERYHRDEQDNRLPQTARISVRKRLLYHRESRQCALPLAAFLTRNIDKQLSAVCTVFRSLFLKVVDVHKPFCLTLINVAFTGLSVKGSTNTKLDGFLQPLSVQPAPDRQTGLQQEKVAVVKTKKIIPGDVDMNVFEILPEDIQKELLESWKNSTVGHGKSPTSQGKQTGIKKYFSDT
jgi:DNA polymerase iota